MREMVSFSYEFVDEHSGEMKSITLQKKSGDEGITSDALCEQFVDFMVSAGFSDENIYHYFQED